MSAPKKGRLAYIDNVRIFLSMLVVAHHAGQPYGSEGWWLFQTADRSPWVSLFFGVNEAFFMGLFFLMAGYFHPGSVDRKGPLKFVLDRFWRFGVPISIMVFGITPIFIYQHDVIFKHLPAVPYLDFFKGVYLGITDRPAGWPGDPGIHLEHIHLWFIQNLFVYGLIYAVYRFFAGARDQKPAVLPSEPIDARTAHGMLVLLVLWLFLSTFLIRMWKGVDDWKVLFWVWEVEFAHVPQYVTMFVLGIIAARKNWFERFPAQAGMTWLWIGLACTLVWAARGVGLPMPVGIGGVTLGDVVRAFWESLLCVSFCAGILTLTRERFPNQTKLARALSDSSFAVYVFHVPVVTLMQFALADVAMGPIAKFALVTVGGILVCFPLAHYVLLRIPVLGKALS